MRSVFDDTCISSIIQNLAANNLSTEIVLLFRALLNSEFLKMEQIASLNQLLQVIIPNHALLLPYALFEILNNQGYNQLLRLECVYINC